MHFSIFDFLLPPVVLDLTGRSMFKADWICIDSCRPFDVQNRLDMNRFDLNRNQADLQLEFLIERNNTGPNTYTLGDALGLAQHHDAVSGTEKKHTTDDYAKRLAIGASEVKGFPLGDFNGCATGTFRALELQWN